uniref:Uncharacterized protein n=1 Tax=Arundo donax TaxID=35708 RepID=A0A0A8ZM58_ARUDO
MKMYFYIH